MPVLAVAALSARVLAEAAHADGFEVVALDLFGDLDTRRACARWWPIGEPERLHIDAERLLAALGRLAQRADVVGWIAGAGFDGRPELLARGAALLPLLGTQADGVRRVRDPHAFFAYLDAHGIAHPPVRMTAPADRAGWLLKDAGACGAWHIRRDIGAIATEHDDGQGGTVAGRRYFQREMAGAPMSATFIANGSDACVLGFNRLIVRSLAARPFVFCGAIGPLHVPYEVAGRVIVAVRALAAEFSLRGLGSLDFMLDGDRFGVLEVNPRPPATMALYGRGVGHDAPRGIVAAHVRACLHDELGSPMRSGEDAVDAVQGTEILFAPRPFWLSERAAAQLAERGGCHDLPYAPAHFEAGDPVCSVSASGSDPEQVLELLTGRREALRSSLELQQ